MRLLARVDVTFHEIYKPFGKQPGNFHLAASNEAGDILGPICNVVLHCEDFQNVAALDRQENAARQVQPQFMLQVVRFVFERPNAFLRAIDRIEIAGDDCLE